MHQVCWFFLAKLDANGVSNLFVIQNIPDGLRDLLFADEMGTCFPRGD